MPKIKYEVHRDGKLLGKATKQELEDAARSGQLRPDDLIRKEGQSDFFAARDISPLNVSFAKDPPPPPQRVPPEQINATSYAPNSETGANASETEEDDGSTEGIGPESQWLRKAGLFCVGFAIADFLLANLGIYDLWSGVLSSTSWLNYLTAIVVGGIGSWLLSLAKKPTGPQTRPALIAGGILSAFLLLVALTSLGNDDIDLVQSGYYDLPLCSDTTVGEMVDNCYRSVIWTSFIADSDERVVEAICKNAVEVPTFSDEDGGEFSRILVKELLSGRLVVQWTIDADDQFFMSYTEKDGRQVDPDSILTLWCSLQEHL
ncbi:GYF domain-containing protein [Phycisphaerales bacterium]|nr:GYF domain-containing protein [Phycisphaerales bacterium]